MAGAYRIGGTIGLVALKAAILGGVLALLARRLYGSTPVVSTAVLTLAMICLLPVSLTVRPHLWSAAALALLITLLDRPAPPDWRRVVATMLLFGFWANLHGGWITGAAVLCVYASVRAWRERKALLRWIAIVGLSLAATLVNPYGPGLWQFLIRTVRSSRPDITEWQPLSLALPPSPDWIGVIAPIALAVALSARRFNRLPAETWATILLLVAAAVRVSRVGPLMVPACLLLLAPYINEQWGQVGRVTVRRGGASAVFWIPVLVLAAAAGRSTVTALACVPDRGAWIPDREAAARLEGASGRLWTTFNWGEYAIWHLGPAIRVSIDGRRETVYSDAMLETHRAFERGDPEAAAVFSSLAPEFVWLPSADAAARTWLANNGYRIDADTSRSFIAVRKDLPILPSSRAQRPACFP